MHKIRIDFDEESNTLTVTHRTSVEIGGHVVSHSEEVQLADRRGAIETLKTIIDNNRTEMEKRTTRLAIQHAAAVSGNEQPNVKKLVVGGNLGAIGGAETKKL